MTENYTSQAVIYVAAEYVLAYKWVLVYKNPFVRRLNKAYVAVDDTVKRTAAQVDSKYDVSGKAQQAASQ